MDIPIPETPFFLFGMGARPKLLYRDGQLLDAVTGAVRFAWDVKHAIIDPPMYVVYIETQDDEHIAISAFSRRAAAVASGGTGLSTYLGSPRQPGGLRRHAPD